MLPARTYSDFEGCRKTRVVGKKGLMAGTCEYLTRPFAYNRKNLTDVLLEFLTRPYIVQLRTNLTFFQI